MGGIPINENETETIKVCSYNCSMELGKTISLTDTIVLLDILNESPKQYKDIFPNLSLSDATLSRRLEILQTLNLIRKEPIRSHGRKLHVYNLTITGVKVLKFIKFYENEVKLLLSQQKNFEIM